MGNDPIIVSTNSDDMVLRHSEEFSPLFEGLKSKVNKIGKNIRSNKIAKQGRQKTKADAKLLDAKARVEAAKGLSKPSPTVKMPAAPKTDKADSKGLSTGAIIGIGAGVLLLVGGIIFFVIKKKKK